MIHKSKRNRLFWKCNILHIRIRIYTFFTVRNVSDNPAYINFRVPYFRFQRQEYQPLAFKSQQWRGQTYCEISRLTQGNNFWSLRLETSFVDPDWFNCDPVPDPDPGIWWKKLFFILKKNCNTFIQGLHEGHPSNRRRLQHSKDNIQYFKTWIFFFLLFFVRHFCPTGSGSDSQSGSGYGPSRPKSIRILIHNTEGQAVTSKYLFSIYDRKTKFFSLSLWRFLVLVSDVQMQELGSSDAFNILTQLLVYYPRNELKILWEKPFT